MVGPPLDSSLAGSHSCPQTVNPDDFGNPLTFILSSEVHIVFLSRDQDLFYGPFGEICLGLRVTAAQKHNCQTYGSTPIGKIC